MILRTRMFLKVCFHTSLESNYKLVHYVSWFVVSNKIRVVLFEFLLIRIFSGLVLVRALVLVSLPLCQSLINPSRCRSCEGCRCTREVRHPREGKTRFCTKWLKCMNSFLFALQYLGLQSLGCSLVHLYGYLHNETDALFLTR